MNTPELYRKYCLQVRHYKLFRWAGELTLCITDKFNKNNIEI
jgi:hypothetical protein